MSTNKQLSLCGYAFFFLRRYMRARTHTHTHTYVYTHTHTRAPGSGLLSGLTGIPDTGPPQSPIRSFEVLGSQTDLLTPWYEGREQIIPFRWREGGGEGGREGGRE